QAAVGRAPGDGVHPFALRPPRNQLRRMVDGGEALELHMTSGVRAPNRAPHAYMTSMAAALQPSLFADAPAPSGLPEGFVYAPEFLTPAAEADLAAWLATLPFEPFQFRGYEGRRRVISFGWKYDFTRSHLTQADDMPAELLAVRARAAALAGLAPGD